MLKPGRRGRDRTGRQEIRTGSAPVATTTGPPPATFDLGGSGSNFLWTVLPSVVTLAVSVFLVSFSVRSLGTAAYGTVTTIAAGTAILGICTSALRFAVVRTSAQIVDDDPGDHNVAAVRAAHTLYVVAAGLIILLAVCLGWLIPLDLHQHGKAATNAYLVTLIMVTASALPLFAAAPQGILNGRERFRALTVVSLMSFVVQAGLTVALIHPLGVFGIAWAQLCGGMSSTVVTFMLARRDAPWLRMLPARPQRGALRSVIRYASGVAVLNATATISSSSDAFVIGSMVGPGGSAVFRVGLTAPSSIAGLMYSMFGVLFPRLARSSDQAEQEEGIAWMGRIVGWVNGIGFAALAVLGPDVTRLLLGHRDHSATVVLWLASAALAVDVSYHGVVNVILARGEAGFLAKYSWIELIVNLGATIILVHFFGLVGSAWALCVTIAVTDIIGFPIIMRGRWGTPAGRYVITHGLGHSIASACLVSVPGFMLASRTSGLGIHLVTTGTVALAALIGGCALLTPQGRSRLIGLFSRRHEVVA